MGFFINKKSIPTIRTHHNTLHKFLKHTKKRCKFASLHRFGKMSLIYKKIYVQSMYFIAFKNMIDIKDCLIYRNEEKDLILQKTRNISFYDIEHAIQSDQILSLKKNMSNKYSHQYMLIIHFNSYTYDVPFVYDSTHNTIFLKTIYPNRKHLYLIHNNHDNS